MLAARLLCVHCASTAHSVCLLRIFFVFTASLPWICGPMAACLLRPYCGLTARFLRVSGVAAVRVSWEKA